MIMITCGRNVGGSELNLEVDSAKVCLLANDSAETSLVPDRHWWGSLFTFHSLTTRQTPTHATIPICAQHHSSPKPQLSDACRNLKNATSNPLVISVESSCNPAMVDTDNLRTASLYINNQLLSRGLLKDGQSIEFADPGKPGRESEATMSQIMTVVNDLILRRDVRISRCDLRHAGY